MQHRVLVGLIVLGTTAFSVGAQSLSSRPLDNAIGSTVLIRTKRVLMGQTIPSSGSGFFISPDGYIMTNWHVIGDELQLSIMGEPRTETAKVLQVSVVVKSGTPDQKELPARVVIWSKRKDLAVVKIDIETPHFLEPSRCASVSLADRVWVVGFPYGDYLSADATERSPAPDSSPEISLNSGMVTSLRKDTKGRLRLIQTDAAVNPGNSGGPLLDDAGQLAGVISSKIVGSSGIGFAIPPNDIQGFVRANAVKVELAPGVVLNPPAPITVTVHPALVQVADASGTARLEGADIETVQFPLHATPAGDLTTTITVPERRPGSQPAARYTITVALYSSDGTLLASHRLPIDVVPDSFARVGDSTSSLNIMRKRNDPLHEVLHESTLSDYTRSGGSEARTLSDYARSTQLKRSEDGVPIIDNRATTQINTDFGAVPELEPERYQHLEGLDLVILARRYDEAVLRMEKLEKAMLQMIEAVRQPRVLGAWKPYEAIYQEITAEINRLSATLNELGTQPGASSLCRCSAFSWYRCSEVSCSEPEQPSYSLREHLQGVERRMQEVSRMRAGR